MELRYFNRETSWLEFNLRVLEEAMDTGHPLLERVKFLSIFYSNLDEFVMIRVSGLSEQAEAGGGEMSKDGLSARQQISIIRDRMVELEQLAWGVYHEDLVPALKREGVVIAAYQDLSEVQKGCLARYFETTIYPVLTPLAVDPGHPFPRISNLSLSLAVVIRDPDGLERFARVKVPPVLPRFVLIPAGRSGKNGAAMPDTYVLLEEVVAAHLQSLFRGMEVESSFAFRVVRDADIEIREDEAGDLLQSVERSIKRRRFGSVITLHVASDMPPHIRTLLVQNLQIEASAVYDAHGPLGLSDLMMFHDLPRPELKDPPFQPYLPVEVRGEADLFERIRQRDILLHHPFDSFKPVVDLVQLASRDPDVLAIKQTIYRVGQDSPIIEALLDAAAAGKQVSVVVELKARFDEQHNIEWARVLEKAGAHVVYGDIELKTHCKVLLIVRKDPDGIRRYVHMGTGNYNDKTAKVYTDLGLLTCHPGIGEDVSALFNSLTGYSVNTGYRELLVSPGGIRDGILARIDREIEHAKAGRDARLIFKVNAITDSISADALYAASEAGVQIDLIARTSCCVRPGVPGLSENIRVRSIVGRFLEHHRIYYFQNGGDEEVWLGSADLMGRNLDKRVEILFRIEDDEQRRWLAHEMLPVYLRDTRRARAQRPDGRYERILPHEGEEPLDAQLWFLEHAAERSANANPEVRL